MNLILIITAIFCIFAISLVISMGKSKDAFLWFVKIIFIVATIGIGFLIGLSIALGIEGIFSNSPEYAELYSSTELVPFHTTENGECYIAKAYTNDELVYCCAYENENGIVSLEKDADDIYLKAITDPSMSPCIMKYKIYYSNHILNFLLGTKDTMEIMFIPEESLLCSF